MDITTIILRPLIGAVIGYITNDIAIRMLFRPRTAKYIFGIKVPFTPGIIPKEKSRIARSIGNAISENLMNRDVLEKSLLSPSMLDKIGNSFDEFIAVQKRNAETIEEYLTHFLSLEDINTLKDGLSKDLAGQIHSALAYADLGPRIAHMVTEHVTEKIRNSIAGFLGASQLIGFISGKAEELLSRHINEMLANNSQQMVGTLIVDQTNLFLSTPVSDLLEGRDEQISQVRRTLLNLYCNLITDQLPRVLDALDISRIIEERINDMDVKDSERLILEVMNKELKAIVWLGALLGFVMGCVNLLF